MTMTRRAMIAGTAASAFALSDDAWAYPNPPRLRPDSLTPVDTRSLIAAGRLSGRTGCVLIDLQTGRIRDAVNADGAFIPASVMKTAGALFARDVLGPAYRFRTSAQRASNGAARLVGGGDPTLDTAALAALAEEAAPALAGARALIYDDRALTPRSRLNAGQPEHAAYNPGLSGLNLNFNRVMARWRRRRRGLQIGVYAQSAGLSLLAPDIGVVARTVGAPESGVFAPVYGGNEGEIWAARASALRRSGRRWLPVRDSGRHTATMFKVLMERAGLEIPRGPAVGSDVAARIVAMHESAPLDEILPAMLKYSTNLTAECVGEAAAGQARATLAQWLRHRAPQVSWRGFQAENYSGLSTTSRMTPRQAAEIARLGVQTLGDTFWEMHPKFNAATINYPPAVAPEFLIRAKTGTMYFARGLAGLTYVEGRMYAFAIFSTDFDKRAALDAAFDPNADGPPPGGRSWTARSRRLEAAILRNWVAMTSA